MRSLHYEIREEKMKLCLINASNPVNTQIEWDEYVDYREGYEACFDGKKILKKCRSWHSIPALFNGEFFVYNKPNWQGVFKYDVVIVLVNRDLEYVKPLISKLKTQKKKVFVGFHENGADFMIQSMDLRWLLELQSLVSSSDGYINVIPQFHDMMSQIFKGKKVVDLYHPAPFGIWDTSHLTTDQRDREGVMIATRTLNQRIPRNTINSLFLAQKLADHFDTFFTYVNEDPDYFINDLKRLGLDRMRVVQGAQSYEDWLKLLGSHKFVFHMDTSFTLGQVVSDAALVNNMVFGGNADNNSLNDTDRWNEDLFDTGKFVMEDASNEYIPSKVNELSLHLNPSNIRELLKGDLS